MSLKLKNCIFSIFLFNLICIGLVQAGCVTITVQYNDGCPRSGANVYKISPSPTVGLGNTGNDGKVTKCSLLNPGDYIVQSYYPSGTQFGPNTGLHVDSNGDGSATITKNANYLNGTESCGGDAECDGYKYCYAGSPNYIQCDSWNTDCDTKKCCLCNGGSQVNPTQNYDSTQNVDCDACNTCSAIDTCSPQTGNNGNKCNAECTYCSSGSCINRNLCDITECLSGWYCGSSGGSCIFNNPSCITTTPTTTTSTTTTTIPTLPIIKIISPKNTIYFSRSVPLTFTVNKPTSWCGYSLDGSPNVTLVSCANKTLTGLVSKTHNIVVYANDTSGNMGVSNKVYFSVSISGGGCPILKVYQNNKLTRIEKLNLHSPKDKDVIVTSTFNMQPVNGKYEIILDEAAYLFWDGSHIDSVSLKDETGKECNLISATHSKKGDVLSEIAKSDDIRVRSYPGDRITLTYDGCSGNIFTFSIEGYNMKTPMCPVC